MNDPGRTDYGRRVLVSQIALGLMFLALVGRLVYMQILSGQQYMLVSDKNRIRRIALDAQRGLILDRHGEVLVENLPAFSAFGLPYVLRKDQAAIEMLARILEISEGEVRQRLRQSGGLFTPAKLKRHIPFQMLTELEENRLELPGVDYRVDPMRAYPAGVRASHLFGYVGEISSAELAIRKEDGYIRGDLIGKRGLERQYEDQLRGKKGVRYVEVDARGREVRTLNLKGARSEPALPGQNLVLTLDADMQRKVEAQFEEKRGGAVFIETRTGEVLAMVSKPDYDLNLFAKPIERKVWQELLNDPDKPLYDRMLQSLYPPGSTFKLVLALAALQSGVAKPERTTVCNGYFRLGTRPFACWKRGGHGRVDMYGALEGSCNVYFYKLGLDVGIDIWSNFARMFEFDRPTRIDIVGEKTGFVPTREYFEKKYQSERWPKGLVVNLAVGQGDLLVTPIQMGKLAMILANRGYYFRPHLLKGIRNQSEDEWRPVHQDTMRIQGVGRQAYEVVLEGMRRVVHGARGTAKSLSWLGITVAGKTGTAQNPHGEAHAWFIGFAPFEAPEVAWAVVVENGGSGGAVAAPIAREVLKVYLKKRQGEEKAKDGGRVAG